MTKTETESGECLATAKVQDAYSIHPIWVDPKTRLAPLFGA